MQKILQKIFGSDKLFLATPFVYSISAIIAFAFELQSFDFSIYSFVIFCALLFGLVIAFKKHEKNVMKAGMGAVLMGNLNGSLTIVEKNFEFEGIGFNTIISIIMLVIGTVFFVSHFVLAYGHKAKPGVVKLNQILVVIAFLLNIFWNIISPYDKNAILLAAIDIISASSFLIMVVCIETRVDSYKLAREAKGYKAE